MNNAIQIKVHASYWPNYATLPNLTRAEFELSVANECKRRGVAQLASFDETCRCLAVQIFCDGFERDAHGRPLYGNGCAPLATYLSSGCNVRFQGEL